MRCSASELESDRVGCFRPRVLRAGQVEEQSSTAGDTLLTKEALELSRV